MVAATEDGNDASSGVTDSEAPDKTPSKAKDRPPFQDAEEWLAAHKILVLLAVIALSVAFRAIYFVQLNDGPCVWQSRWDQSDMHFFDDWAKQIAAGDWLSEDVKHPLHGWHRQVAKEYYREHPEELASLQAAGVKDTDRAIWERWCGQRRFYQDPLYPYLLAGVYKVFGSDVRWMFALQMLAGVAGNVIVLLLARRFFCELVGAVAAAMALLCGPILFYEMVLVRETFISLAGLGLVYLTVVAMDRGTWRWWLALGLAAGLSVLLKAHFTVYLAGVLLAILIRCRKSLRGLAVSLPSVLVGFFVAMAPLIARNVSLNVSPLTTTSAGGITFIGSNTSRYGAHGFGMDVPAAAEIMAETEGRMLPTMARTIQSHPSMRTYLSLMRRKFVNSWHWYEIPSNVCFDYYRLHSSLLWSLPVTFFILSPLSLVGLVLALRKFRACWPLYLLVGTSFLVLLMFHVMSRHRRPLAAALIPFAALTVVWTARALLGRRTRGGVGALIAVLALGIWSGSALPRAMWRVRTVDCFVAYSGYYDVKAEQAVQDERWREAALILEESLQHRPLGIMNLGPGNPPASADQQRMVALFGTVRVRCAELYRKAGMKADADRHMQRARVLRSVLGRKKR